MGVWFKKYPGHFLDGAYLRYVGWVLSDSTTQVRLEAVKALSGVYAQVDYVGSLNHFTERFKPRLIEMAEGDTELTVRVSVIQVLEAIDGHSLLEDEERERLCLLVFDEEAKVRKAVSAFVRGAWQDTVDERLAGRKLSREDKNKVGVKVLAALLVKWGKALDKVSGNDSEDNSSDDATGGVSRASGMREAGAIAGLSRKGRTAHAVEALWDAVDPVSDWEGLLDLLLLDHSSAREDDLEGSTMRANGDDHSDDSTVDEAWRLEEAEEGVLLEVFVAALARAKADVAGGKKVSKNPPFKCLYLRSSCQGEEDTVVNDITQALIKGLPRLFIKHQTDQTRIAEVLLIPTLMNLDLYLEMRMITVSSATSECDRWLLMYCCDRRLTLVFGMM
jgi:cohesin complex subunit SA-1/2